MPRSFKGPGVVIGGYDAAEAGGGGGDEGAKGDGEVAKGGEASAGAVDS